MCCSSTSSDAYTAFWAIFVCELLLASTAIYDATSLSGGIPGFGVVDHRFFGISTHEYWPILYIRAALWTLFAGMVAQTSDLGATSLLIAGATYFGLALIGTSVSLPCFVVSSW